MTVHPHISESAAEAVDIHAVHYPSTETAQCPYPYYKALPARREVAAAKRAAEAARGARRSTA